MRGYKNISAGEFKKLKEENPNVVVLDVRTPAEVRQGKIPGATNMEVTGKTFFEELNEMDKNNIYLLYCRSGARSAQACDFMAGKGFANLFNLSGGISQWPYQTA